MYAGMVDLSGAGFATKFQRCDNATRYFLKLLWHAKIRKLFTPPKKKLSIETILLPFFQASISDIINKKCALKIGS